MESALYGIFTLVGFVSEISLVRCAHSFDFRCFTNSCENPVRTRFPWSNLYMFTVTPFEQTLIKSFSVICVNRTITLNVVRRKPSQITEWSFFSLVFIVYVHSPVLIGSFHSRQRSRSWNFWKRGLIWKSLTSDPTQTPLRPHLRVTKVIGFSIGPSVVQNIPCGRKGPEGLHLYGRFLRMENDANCWNKKAWKTKNFCMWRTAIQR